jgi:hypothetical protein
LEKRKKMLINSAKRVGLAARQVHGIKLTPGPKGFFPKCFMFLVKNFGALHLRRFLRTREGENRG